MSKTALITTPYRHTVYINPEGDLFFQHQIEEMYEDILNDCYEAINICGYNYDAGRALKLIDKIAFDEGTCNYLDSLLSDEGWTESAMTYKEQQAHNELVESGKWEQSV